MTKKKLKIKRRFRERKNEKKEIQSEWKEGDW